MKIYAEEYNWQNDIKLVEVRLFGLSGEWFEVFESGAIPLPDLFTSYRAASSWLLERGYSCYIDEWSRDIEISFEKIYDEYNRKVVKIIEMEVIR